MRKRDLAWPWHKIPGLGCVKIPSLLQSFSGYGNFLDGNILCQKPKIFNSWTFWHWEICSIRFWLRKRPWQLPAIQTDIKWIFFKNCSHDLPQIFWPHHREDLEEQHVTYPSWVVVCLKINSSITADTRTWSQPSDHTMMPPTTSHVPLKTFIHFTL